MTVSSRIRLETWSIPALSFVFARINPMQCNDQSLIWPSPSSKPPNYCKQQPRPGSVIGTLCVQSPRSSPYCLRIEEINLASSSATNSIISTINIKLISLHYYPNECVRELNVPVLLVEPLKLLELFKHFLIRHIEFPCLLNALSERHIF